MTEDMPPEPSHQDEPCRSAQDHPEASLGASDESVSSPEEEIDRLDQGDVSTEGIGPSERPSDQPSVAEAGPRPADSPDFERSRPPGKRWAFREMGWKMMAVAGTALLLAGFVAGLFLPGPVAEEAVSDQVPVATTPETVPATTSAPATTVPPATTSAPTTAPERQPASEVVPPPDLVVTDEPVADVADRLVPSVVHLEISGDDLFERGAGSGVIFDSGGYILTAAHVVATVVTGEAELTVRLSNGDRLPGEVVGADPDSDVAVVRVDRSGLVAAEFVLNPPRVGQLVVAVGSPWGLESSVTSGVISATDRIVDGRLLIQSDAVLYRVTRVAHWRIAMAG